MCFYFTIASSVKIYYFSHRIFTPTRTVIDPLWVLFYPFISHHIYTHSNRHFFRLLFPSALYTSSNLHIAFGTFSGLFNRPFPVFFITHEHIQQLGLFICLQSVHNLTYTHSNWLFLRHFCIRLQLVCIIISTQTATESFFPSGEYSMLKKIEKNNLRRWVFFFN